MSLTATFHYPTTDKTSVIKYPEVARGLTRGGYRPDKCVIEGTLEDVDHMQDYKSWVYMNKSVLLPNGKLLINVGRK